MRGLMGNHRFVYEGFHHNAEVTYLAAARSTPSPGSAMAPAPGTRKGHHYILGFLAPGLWWNLASYPY